MPRVAPVISAPLPLPSLIAAVSSHVTAVLGLIGSGVAVVQVGNEISPGALFPSASQACGDSGRVAAPCEGNWAALGALIGAGITAARAAAPGALIAIHTDLGNRGAQAGAASVQWYKHFSQALPAGCDYDAIALSYYLQWGAAGPSGEVALAEALRAAFPGKQLLMAETSYPWAGTSAPGPWPATPQGQADFWAATVGNASAAGFAGVAWWGGEYAGAWTALFDANYVALPALLQGFLRAP